MSTLAEELTSAANLDAEVQRQTRTLRADNARLTGANDDLTKRIDFYEGVSKARLHPPRWVVKAPKARAAHHALVVAQLTDTHFDEVVNPSEVLGLNAYSREIALSRFRRWSERVVSLPRTYVSGLQLDGLVVLATGDLLSGDIHEELKNSNEDHLYASAVFWIERIIAALTLLWEEYHYVHVAAVVGNHGRSTIKPVFKGRAHSNIEWFIWKQVEQRMSACVGLTFAISDSMDLNVPIYGRNHLITHGDQFHGGSGISGALAPLMLGKHRKTVRQMATSQPMDQMVMGHFHQLLTLPGLTVGGSMKGYDEYAFGLNLNPEQAAQAMWITTPEYLRTVSIPVFLQDKKAEGW